VTFCNISCHCSAAVDWERAPEMSKTVPPTITARDVARSIQAEAETGGLRERIQALEEMIDERDLLIGAISHELRAPLTTIYGNAHLLLRLQGLDEDSRRRATTDIFAEAERLSGLLENLLLLARGIAQAAIPTEPILLDMAISQVASEHCRRFKERPVRVSVKPRDLLAEGQPEYLSHILQNLMGNAEKYSPPDQRIDIRARRRAGEVIISIVNDHLYLPGL
jgi:signal transduction histidine kinase